MKHFYKILYFSFAKAVIEACKAIYFVQFFGSVANFCFVMVQITTVSISFVLKET